MDVGQRHGAPGAQRELEGEQLATRGGGGVGEGEALTRQPPLPGHVWFHVVAAGEMLLSDEHRLRRADVALVTTGAGHVLRSEPGAPAPGILDLEREHVSERYEILRHGGDGAVTRLLCGAIHFDHPAARNLIDALPPFVHIEATDDGVEALHATPALITAETRRPRPGGALAGELAMSRSAFAARFTELVGLPAMQYVTRWRMQVARTALAEDGATVAQAARSVASAA